MATPLTWAINTGQTKEPPQAKKDQGWNPEEPAAAQFINWWMKHVEEYMARVALSFVPHQETIPVMTVRLEAGALWDGESLTEISAQSTGTIVAPTVDPRIDRTVVDRETGVVSVVTGTEAPSPVAPAVPVKKLPNSQISLIVGQTTIVNQDITDERVLETQGKNPKTLADADATIALSDLNKLLIITPTVARVLTLPSTGVVAGDMAIIRNTSQTTSVRVNASGGASIIKYNFAIQIFVAGQDDPTSQTHWDAVSAKLSGLTEVHVPGTIEIFRISGIASVATQQIARSTVGTLGTPLSLLAKTLSIGGQSAEYKQSGIRTGSTATYTIEARIDGNGIASAVFAIADVSYKVSIEVFRVDDVTVSYNIVFTGSDSGVINVAAGRQTVTNLDTTSTQLKLQLSAVTSPDSIQQENATLYIRM